MKMNFKVLCFSLIFISYSINAQMDCEKKLGISYEDIGYSKDSNLIYFHKSCFPKYPNTNPPIVNNLIRLTSQRLKEYLNYCLDTSDRVRITNILENDLSSPFLVNCEDKIDHVLYVDPKEILIGNQHINEARVVKAIIKKYGLSVKSDVLSKQIPPACFECCHGNDQNGDKCCECFYIREKEKKRNNTTTLTQRCPGIQPKRAPDFGLKPSLDNLQKVLLGLIDKKSECDQTCKESIFEILSFDPAIQNQYYDVVIPDSKNKAKIRKLSDDEIKYLVENKFKDELKQIRESMSRDGKKSPADIQKALDEFILIKLKNDPLIALREKHIEETTLLHVNLVLVDGKTSEEADKAVDEFLEQKLSQELPPDNKVITPIDKTRDVFVKHIQLITKKSNLEEIRRSLDETMVDVCSRPKDNQEKALQNIMIEMRKKMARRVIEDLSIQNRKRKPLPPSGSDDEFIRNLIKYERMRKTGC